MKKICIKKKHISEPICHIHQGRPCFRFQLFTFCASPKFFKIKRYKTRKNIVVYGVFSWCFSSTYIKCLLDRDISMYYYSSTDKILNTLLITSADRPERNMFKRNIFKLENRKFLVYYVILVDTSKNNLRFWKITFDFFWT